MLCFFHMNCNNVLTSGRSSLYWTMCSVNLGFVISASSSEWLPFSLHWHYTQFLKFFCFCSIVIRTQYMQYVRYSLFSAQEKVVLMYNLYTFVKTWKFVAGSVVTITSVIMDSADTLITVVLVAFATHKSVYLPHNY